jgi:hypothetical protein
MTIDINKQYTSNGKPVRILCTNKGGEYPVVAIIGNDVDMFTLDGKRFVGEDNRRDLKEVWTPTQYYYYLLQ